MILDGEIIVINKSTGKPAPFGMNKTIAMEENEDSEFQLSCIIFFVMINYKTFQ